MSGGRERGLAAALLILAGLAAVTGGRDLHMDALLPGLLAPMPEGRTAAPLAEVWARQNRAELGAALEALASDPARAAREVETLGELLDSGDASVLTLALSAIGAAGPAARSLLPAVHRHARSARGDIRGAGVLALSHIEPWTGGDPLDGLDFSERYKAWRWVHRFSPELAMHCIETNLFDPKAPFLSHEQALDALGRLGAAGAPMVPGLIARLDSPVFVEVRRATEALGRLAPSTPPARAALEARQADREPALRYLVALALGSVTPSDLRVIREFFQSLLPPQTTAISWSRGAPPPETEVHEMVDQAIARLPRHGPDAGAWADLVGQLLSHGVNGRFWVTSGYLGELGPLALGQENAMVAGIRLELSHDNPWMVTMETLRALAKTGAHGPTYVALLRDLLALRGAHRAPVFDLRVLEVAVASIRALGPTRAELAPELRQARTRWSSEPDLCRQIDAALEPVAR